MMNDLGQGPVKIVVNVEGTFKSVSAVDVDIAAKVICAAENQREAHTRFHAALNALGRALFVLGIACIASLDQHTIIGSIVLVFVVGAAGSHFRACRAREYLREQLKLLDDHATR